MSQWVVSLFSLLLSGVFAALISSLLYIRYERRREKLSVLKQLMGNRHGLTPHGDSVAHDRFIQALNITFVLFHKSQPVIEILNIFRKEKGKTAENTVRLIRRMSEELGIDTSALDDGFFDEPFAPGKIH